jgi:hypothetical protein
MSDREELADDLTGSRLYRTQYLVLPKLAIQDMPIEWQARLEELLHIADEAGMATPSYIVLRDEPEYALRRHEDPDDDESPLDEVAVNCGDPWANYRRGSAADLCAFDINKAESLLSAKEPA